MPIEIKKKIKIYLIGTGKKKYIDQIKLEIKNNGLEEYFKITGYVDCSSLIILSRLDLLISLTRDFEGFGITCAQALLMKKPILATNVGAISEFLDDKNAKLIKPNNIREIKMAILDFINNQGKWERKALKGNRLIKEKFDISKTSKKYYSYLISFLNKNCKPEL